MNHVHRFSQCPNFGVSNALLSGYGKIAAKPVSIGSSKMWSTFEITEKWIGAYRKSKKAIKLVVDKMKPDGLSNNEIEFMTELPPSLYVAARRWRPVRL
jgi:hypothetical protein